MTEYVAGFMFNRVTGYDHVDKVALIRKNRPAWQAGKLNGIGGHIELNETPEGAMRREFFEETGVQTTWKKFCVLTGPNYVVHFFYTFGVLEELKTTTDEEVVIVPISEVDVHNSISNLIWLIPMAQEKQGSPGYYSIEDF